jgi:hypothetical protein
VGREAFCQRQLAPFAQQLVGALVCLHRPERADQLIVAAGLRLDDADIEELLGNEP